MVCMFVVMCGVFLLRCGSFTGIVEPIDFYTFNTSTEKLIISIDNFLRENPEYYKGVSDSWGTISIKIPEIKERFSFRIGGLGEIRLMAAGKINDVHIKGGQDLFSSQKKKYSDSFNTHFLNKLEYESIEAAKQILVNPFLLTINEEPDINSWDGNHYVFKIDTLLTYPLPIEFDSLSYDFLENLIECYGKYIDQKISVIQYKTQFRVNKSYSGYIGDSIYIDSCYRVIGQNEISESIFETKDWKKYLENSNVSTRLNDYTKQREEDIAKGYMETQVYSKYSKEFWMRASGIENNTE